MDLLSKKNSPDMAEKTHVNKPGDKTKLKSLLDNDLFREIGSSALKNIADGISKFADSIKPAKKN